MSAATCVTDSVDKHIQELNVGEVGWEMQPKYWLQSPQFHLMGCRCANVDDTTAEKTHVGTDGFQICLDVQNFVASEISVKTVYDFIEIHAKHGDREDEHRYRLPAGFNIEDVVSSISADGILIVRAPRPMATPTGSKVREIEIQRNGPVGFHVNERMECLNARDVEDMKL